MTMNLKGVKVMKKINVLLAMILLMVIMGCGQKDDAPFWMPSPSITSANNTTFTEGTAGTFTFTATGGWPTVTWTLTGTLPSGVTFNAATGILSGTPELGSSGTYPLTITASNGFSSVTQNFTLTVASGQTFGVVALSNVNSIGILDGKTQSLTAVKLTDALGSAGGGLFDVVISPDGKTTVISNFGDSKVYFIDTSDPTVPMVKGYLTLGFFAEDMAMTPDGKYLLVTDGGFSSKIAVVDVASRTLVEEFEAVENTTDPLNPWTPQFQSVAIAEDGMTVLTADYWNLKINVLTISDTGHLTYVNFIDVSNTLHDSVADVDIPTLRPINVDISPDGKTAIVASIAESWKDAAHTIKADLIFPVLNITGPGQVTLTNMVNVGSAYDGSQTVVFNHDGTKAYLMVTQQLPDPYPTDPDYLGPKNVIIVLNVTAPGVASNAGTPIEVEIYGRSQLFGVDTLAVDNSSKYLYVSNPTLSGGSYFIQVIDLTTNTVLKKIDFGSITYNTAFKGDPDADPPVDPDTPVYETTTEIIPVGISFWHP